MEWRETRRRFRRLFLEPSTVGDIRSSLGSEGGLKKNEKIKRKCVRDTEVVKKVLIDMFGRPRRHSVNVFHFQIATLWFLADQHLFW